MKKSSFTVTIEKIVPGGEGLGRHEGRVVFVPYTCAGDVVTVLPRVTKKKYIQADLVSIEEPSTLRVVPLCRHFSRCGGCDYQHIAYETQLALKQEHVRDAFSRIGKITLDRVPSIIASTPWKYRSRVRFQVNNAEGRWTPGFNRANSNEMEPIEECPVLCESLAAQITEYEWSADDAPERRMFGTSDAVYVGAEIFSIRLIERELFLSNDVFFQSNLTLLPRLIECALAGQSGDLAMDLFSGVGLFSVFMQDTFKRVIAVEINRKCQAIAEKHLGSTVERYYLPIEEWVKNNQTTEVDFLLVDPPRQGIDLEALQELLKISARSLVYVSCDPATLARDSALLCAAGYRLDDLTLFDMFPQTAHIESVAKFSRSK